MNLNEPFRRFSVKVSQIVGSPWAFIAALIVIIIWALTGTFFDYSDTWQLVINTGTTIVTFLIVFLIQNTQNRDSKALHIKIDELIKGVRGASNALVDIEDLPDEEIEELHQQFKSLHIRYKKELIRRGKQFKVSRQREIEASK